MLPTIMYLLEVIRRALRKSGRWLSMLGQSFEEALDQSYAARRKYPFAD